ncbi:hypothetical protein AAY473_004272 [Plecturocebus cupreus]
MPDIAFDGDAGCSWALPPTKVRRRGGYGLKPYGASEQTPGPLPIMTPCFQLDPQALQDRDWQGTVIAMNGTSGSQDQKIETILANMVKPHLY